MLALTLLTIRAMFFIKKKKQGKKATLPDFFLDHLSFINKRHTAVR